MTTTWLDDLLTPDAPTTPALVLGTPLQISLSRPARVSVAIEFTVAHGQDCVVTVTADSANPPTTVVGSARIALTDDAASVIIRQMLDVFLQPGDFLLLAKTGTGAAALISTVVNLMA